MDMNIYYFLTSRNSYFLRKKYNDRISRNVRNSEAGMAHHIPHEGYMRLRMRKGGTRNITPRSSVYTSACTAFPVL